DGWEVRDVPVQPAGVVDTEPQPRPTRGVRELEHQVAARAAPYGVAVARPRRVPERDAVVVLGGGDDVACTRAPEQVHHGVRIERLGGPLVEEVVVRRTAVYLLVVPLRGAAVDPDGVRVP